MLRFPPLRTDSQEFLHLDALRIVAAMAIVVFHWGESHAVWLAQRLHLNLLPLASFVDLFFVISGIVICRVYASLSTASDYTTFLRKRFARLAPMHYLTLGIYVAIALAAPALGFALSDPDKYDMACLPANMAFLQATMACPRLSFNFPSWSISAEMICYLAFPLVLAAFRWRVWAPAAIGLALAAGLSLVGPAGPEHRLWVEWTYEWSVLRAFPAFALGVSLYGLRGQLRAIPSPGVLLYVLLAVFLTMAALHAPIGWFTPLAWLIALTGLAADQRKKPDPLVRALAPFGQLTYSVYMLHALFMTLLFSVGFEHILGLHDGAKSVAVILSVPLLLVTAYLSLMLIERPMRRWIQGGEPRVPEAAREDALTRKA